MGYRNANGYGVIRDVYPSTSLLLTHRAAWMLAKGPIPPGMLICHHCDNPPCINAEHLFMGTGSDNMKDYASKFPREWMKGERNHAAKLTEQQVLEIRRRHAAGETQRVLAQEFEVVPQTISWITNNHHWKTVKETSCL